jgi:predicted dehydrogenase
MKQLLQNLRTGETYLSDVPVPAARPGMAVIKTGASLVSAGTERMVIEFSEKSLMGKAQARPDLVRQVIDKAGRDGWVDTIKSAFDRLDQPLTLGYSSSGTIVELGNGLAGFKVGQRVACAGSGAAVHAEYALVPANLMAVLPDGVDFESGAFATLGAVALHGFRLSEAVIGERVAVIGLGLLGLLAAQTAKAAGCRVFGIDLDPERVKLAEELGIRTAVRGDVNDAAMAFTKQRGFDVVLISADSASNDPIELAGVLARDRARIVALGAVGLNIPRKLYFEKELSFINSRSYGPGRYDPTYEEKGVDYPIGYVRWTEGRNLEAMVELMAADKLKVKPLITHRIPLQNAVKAYNLITGKHKEPYLGIVLTYDNEDNSIDRRIEFKSGSSFRLKKDTRGSGVKLGLIGAGNFAKAVLLPAVKKAGSIELVGIASGGGLHAEHAGEKFGFSYAASSEQEILDDPEINTVAILTRHDSHTRLAVAALKAGKHVFVEKPLAVNREQLTELVPWLKKEDGLLLTVGFNRRFAPLTIRLREFLQGRAEAFSAHYRVNAGILPLDHWTHDPVSGGGRIIGEGCHFIDLLTFLAGTTPVRVNCLALPDAGKYHQDNVSITLSFPDGSIGTVDYLANGDKSYSKERLEVFCAGRIAILDDFRSLEMIKDGGRKVMQGTQDKGWISEWKSFAASIREGGAPPIPYDQIVGVTNATFAAMESLATNKTIDL